APATWSRRTWRPSKRSRATRSWCNCQVRRKFPCLASSGTRAGRHELWMEGPQVLASRGFPSLRMISSSLFLRVGLVAGAVGLVSACGNFALSSFADDRGTGTGSTGTPSGGVGGAGGGTFTSAGSGGMGGQGGDVYIPPQMNSYSFLCG